jgi:hypothetical protein
MIEQIEWVPVAERLPDDETSVLVCTSGTAEPVWIGYRDGDAWRDSEGSEIEVVAWAEMPEGLRG